ncbi:RNA polymerase ECF-type sigma factor [Filimonas lacunae]|nr:RNA polymerase ECF-type sigma factor [Filimonas lacunae]
MRKDDELAFSEMYSRFSEKMLRYAYNRTGELTASEEVVQDAFMGLWRNRASTDILNAEAYLATAVKYHAINYLHKHRRLPLACAQVPDNTAAGSLEEHLEFKYLMQRMMQEANRLPAKSRFIFWSHNRNMSVIDIARKLNMKPEAVKKNLYRTIMRLKEVVRSVMISLFF